MKNRVQDIVCYLVLLLITNCSHAEQLNAAELPEAPYETITLIGEEKQIVEGAHECLKEARALVIQLKASANAKITTPLSYALSFVYPTRSTIATMIERITTYVNQLEQLREHIAVMMRRATSAAEFQKGVEITLQKNMQAIGDVAYQDPQKVYVYLLDSDTSGDAKAAEAAKQRGLELTAAQIREKITTELAQQSISDTRKKLLRQVGFLFRNEATKQEFDAYLKGTLALLVIDKDTLAELLAQSMDITQLRAELDAQRAELAKF